MNVVELQPALLPSSFPVSDTRPSLAGSYSKHDQAPSQYVSSRHSSKENKTPPPVEGIDYSPPSTLSYRSSGYDQPGHGSVNTSPPSLAAGKKRLANGDVKDTSDSARESPKQPKLGHSRTPSNLSTTNNAAMLEVSGVPALNPPSNAILIIRAQLSQQLRTRLTYAMVKVQNGWQNHSLDEVESLASASPRSTTFNHYSNNPNLLSPRASIAAQLVRAHSDSSSDSANSNTPYNQAQHQNRPTPMLMSPPASRRGLAPPANIVSRPPQSRRRPTPNMQVTTTATRPAAAQRTPSQNAVLEADAVETLLFMASPHNSGNHGSQLSPVTSVPSVNQFPAPQRSPLRNNFPTSTSPKRVAFSSDTSGSSNAEYTARYGRDKKAIIASLVERLDEDDTRELDEALKLMDRYRAAKVAAA